jgi:flagellar basal-body rod protein FlgG
MRNQAGQIVTPGGSVLLAYQPGEGPPNIPNTPIVIPSAASDIVIGVDGTVTFSSGPGTPVIPAGRIPLVNFVNPAGLTTAGGGLYFDSNSSGLPVPGYAATPGYGAVSQYYTEQSNVNVAEELVSLIAAQRAYEITAKSVSASDQILQKLGQL